jgi:hypothetical protein
MHLVQAPGGLEQPELIPGYAKYFRYSSTLTDALLFNQLWFETNMRRTEDGNVRLDPSGG